MEVVIDSYEPTRPRQRKQWEETIDKLSLTNVKISNALRRGLAYQLDKKSAHELLWDIVEGRDFVRNLGNKGRAELRQALEVAGIPKPISAERQIGERGQNQTTITIRTNPGQLQDYGALAMILTQDADGIEQYGHDIVERFSFWLDLFIEGIIDEDVPELRKQLERAMIRLSTLRP